MTKRIDFYGTAKDVLSILDATEKVFDIKYVYLDELFSPRLSEYDSARNIPEFLVATPGRKMYRQVYLIPPDYYPVPLGRAHISGNTRFSLVPGPISEAIVFSENGLVQGKNMLLASRFYVLGNDKRNLKILASVKLLFTKEFKKVRGWFVGDEAFELLRSGTRLNVEFNAPAMTDLRVEEKD